MSKDWPSCPPSVERSDLGFRFSLGFPVARAVVVFKHAELSKVEEQGIFLSSSEIAFPPQSLSSI